MIETISRVSCDYCGEQIAEISGTSDKLQVLRETRRIHPSTVVSNKRHFCSTECWREYQPIMKGKL